jgi:hypothetical protein
VKRVHLLPVDVPHPRRLSKKGSYIVSRGHIYIYIYIYTHTYTVSRTLSRRHIYALLAGRLPTQRASKGIWAMNARTSVTLSVGTPLCPYPIPYRRAYGLSFRWTVLENLRSPLCGPASVYLGSPIWCARALFRPKVDGCVPHTQHVTL